MIRPSQLDGQDWAANTFNRLGARNRNGVRNRDGVLLAHPCDRVENDSGGGLEGGGFLLDGGKDAPAVGAVFLGLGVVGESVNEGELVECGGESGVLEDAAADGFADRVDGRDAELLVAVHGRVEKDTGRSGWGGGDSAETCRCECCGGKKDVAARHGRTVAGFVLIVGRSSDCSCLVESLYLRGKGTGGLESLYQQQRW